MKREEPIARFARSSFARLAEDVARSAQRDEGLSRGLEERGRQWIVDALVSAVFESICLRRELDPALARTASCRGGRARSLGDPLDSLREALDLSARELSIGDGVAFDDEESLGRLYEALLGFHLDRGWKALPRDARRRSGSHYTPRELADEVAHRTLAPIIDEALANGELEGLRVCDPAMGTGAFALAAARQIARALSERGSTDAEARRIALVNCVRGVDADPEAVRVAKLVAWLHLGDRAFPIERLDDVFVVGDALVGPSLEDGSVGIEGIASYFERHGAPVPQWLSWRDAFPDVFDRENPGFDAFVGNPPFTGGKRIATMLGPAYAGWLRRIHEGANGNVDLSAHFLRRAFDLTRKGGRVGFITTNTIAQGDTRAGGLAEVCARGGVIKEATTRVEWPGDAAVVASIVIVEKVAIDGASLGPTLLDGARVESITAFLRIGTRHADPERLASRKNVAFIGCFLRSMGFTFDDESEAASPHAEMGSLLAHDPAASKIIRPYMGGQELNQSPTHAHHRHVIDFFGLEEPEARLCHPDLVALLERKVRPFRAGLGNGSADRTHRARWWRFANDRPELRARIRGLSRVLAIPRVTAHLSAVFLPTDVICSEQVVVVALEGWDAFALLQSRAHETWARMHSSTLGDGLRYAPSDCFETFPFPRSSESLSEIGRRYYEHRSRWMQEAREGLTATWRRFHDRSDQTPQVVELRRLHDEMDRAVLDAYGFGDLEARATFNLEPFKKARPDGSPSTRLGWSAEVIEAVVRRLTLLNEAEARASRSASVEERPTLTR